MAQIWQSTSMLICCQKKESARNMTHSSMRIPAVAPRYWWVIPYLDVGTVFSASVKHSSNEAPAEYGSSAYAAIPGPADTNRIPSNHSIRTVSRNTNWVINWITVFIEYKRNISYVRCPCHAHGMGCLSLLFLKPK